MSTRFLIAAAAVSLATVCASCSNSGTALYPVRVTVTCTACHGVSALELEK